MQLFRSWQFWIGCLGGIIGTVVLAVAIDAVVPSRPNISRRLYTFSTARGILEALDEFNRDHQRFPSGEEGLTVLVPQYVDHLRPDAWGNSFIYVPRADGERPDVLSYGADGKPGGTSNDADISARLGPLGPPVSSLAYASDYVVPATLAFSLVALLFTRGRSLWMFGVFTGVLFLAALVFLSEHTIVR